MSCPPRCANRQRHACRPGQALPNSGFLNVTVSPDRVKLDDVGSCLPKDEMPGKKNGRVVYSHTR